MTNTPSLRLIALGLLISAFPCSAQAVPEWKLVKEWSVGGEPTGAHSFDAIMGFGLLPNGGFVHLDYRTHQLHFLDAHGGIVRSVGRKGGGPGEFSGLKGLTVKKDGTVIVYDLYNGFQFFSSEGKFLKAVKPKSYPYINGSMWRAIPQPDGQVLDLLALIPSQNQGVSEGLARWAADFSKFDRLPMASCGGSSQAAPYRAPLRDSTGKTLVSMRLPFVEPEIAEAYGEDGFVWEAFPKNSNTLVRHRFGDCNAVARVALGGARPQIEIWQRSVIIEHITAEAKRWRVPAPTLPTSLNYGAWYSAALSDQAGNLWVMRLDAARKAARTEIFSPTGKPIGVINGSLPGMAKITDSHVFGFVADDEGTFHLISYRIVRP